MAYVKVQLCPSLELIEESPNFFGLRRKPERKERKEGDEFGAGQLRGGSIGGSIGKWKTAGGGEWRSEMKFAKTQVKETELCSRRIMKGMMSMKLKMEGERRKRGRIYDCEDSVICDDRERDELRCLIEGEMGDDSSGTEYEPDNEDEGVSDSVLSLESEFSVDEGCIECFGGDEGMCTSTRGDGPSGGQLRGRGGPSKYKVKVRGDSSEIQRSVPMMEGSDVLLRLRCIVKKLVGLNTRMSMTQREVVRATALAPFLEYPDIGMERHLTLALIKCWVPRWKAFRIGRRRVSFSVFDVALLTGLPAPGRIVRLDGDEVTTDVGEMARGRMAEWEREEMVTRLPGRSGKKRRFFRNYVSDMVALYEENNDDDRVGLWVRIYAFMIMSGVLFPHTPYGAAWGMLQYIEDIDRMGEYN
ncbi:hypothetical protein Cgig2_014088 [Carnegiea gigantea]|uniref:Aminotransferase-like plant mobile domain-containing protein n=1 Tax=Carnegiea gigantea TaxID=171969 RepID=A0A9Q1KUU3_9CARY|nr:hypothetical protein Cgig2_014088 [Carnegiea gigantea]